MDTLVHEAFCLINLARGGSLEQEGAEDAEGALRNRLARGRDCGGTTNGEHRFLRPPLSSSVIVDRSSSAGESNHGRGSACLVQSISQPRVTDTHPTHRAILYFNGYPHSALDDLGLDDLGSDLTISLGVMTIRHFHPRQNGL